MSSSFLSSSFNDVKKSSKVLPPFPGMSLYSSKAFFFLFLAIRSAAPISSGRSITNSSTGFFTTSSSSISSSSSFFSSSAIWSSPISSSSSFFSSSAILVNFFNFVCLLKFLSLSKYSVCVPYFHLPTKICIPSRSNFSSLLVFFNTSFHHSGYVLSKNSFFKFCRWTFSFVKKPSSWSVIWSLTSLKLTQLSLKSVSATWISFLFNWGKFLLILRSASLSLACNLISIPSPLTIFLLNFPI